MDKYIILYIAEDIYLLYIIYIKIRLLYPFKLLF